MPSLLALAAALASLDPGSPGAARAPAPPPPLLLVRFERAELELVRRMERRTWSAAVVEGELSRWAVVVREPQELESWIGERGNLAACALDRRGELLGVLRGVADAPRCAAFLRGCAQLARHREERVATVSSSVDGSFVLADVDARLALGVREPLERELECALAARDPQRLDSAQIAERLARLHVRDGEAVDARRALEVLTTSAGPSTPSLRSRLALTRGLLALVERDRAAACRQARTWALDPESTRSELLDALELARGLHEIGADDDALLVAAAIDRVATQGELQLELHELREHVLRSTESHGHTHS